MAIEEHRKFFICGHECWLWHDYVGKPYHSYSMKKYPEHSFVCQLILPWVLMNL